MSVLLVNVYFEESRGIAIKLINNDKILIEFNKEIKYFWIESIIHSVKDINMIVHQKRLKVTIFYIQVIGIIDIKSEFNYYLSNGKDENFDELIYNVWEIVVVRLGNGRNILPKMFNHNRH